MSKLWYGSLMNRLQEGVTVGEIEVGTLATEMDYSDRHPYEIIAIKDERHVTARRLDAKRVDSNGFSECQDYEYTSNPNNRTVNLFKTKDGRWREKYGRGSLGSSFALGFAEEYYDFSF